MNKLIATLIVIVVALTVVWVSLYPLTELSQNIDVKNQTSQLENQESEIEKQHNELENQTSEHEDQNDEPEDENYQKKLPDAKQVEITEAIASKEAGRLGGVIGYIVRIKNYGTNDVDGLTVSVGEDVTDVGLLQAGEEKSFTSSKGFQWTPNPGYDGPDVAVLRFHDEIVDEKEYSWYYH